MIKVIRLLRTTRLSYLLKVLRKRISGQEGSEIRQRFSSELNKQYCAHAQEMCLLRLHALQDNIYIDTIPIEWENVYTFESNFPQKITTKKRWHARPVDDATVIEKQKEIMQEVEYWQDKEKGDESKL